MPPPFPPREEYAELIRLALREDLGPAGLDGDVTSRLTIPADAAGAATVVQKAPGVACGLPIVADVLKAFDARLHVDVARGAEGRFTQASSKSPTTLATLRGPLRSLLAAERTVLNFLGRLSGVATLTHAYAEQVKGTRASVYDTRKTTPGWRALEKYAVACGGGRNHRIGLYDMVLVKDNHVAALSGGGGDLREAAMELVRRSRAEEASRPVEIEVDTVEQFRHVVGVDSVDVILLDNMSLDDMAACVRLRDEAQSRAELEASGGVNLSTIRAIAQTGVERIAVGALTHSAPNLDVGLDLA